jgi:hypothetical protein
MKNNLSYAFFAALLTCGVLLSGATSSSAAVTISILNADGPDEGFNDPTPAEPVGGNPGTTVGQQRLNAFQRAADIWGSTLDSAVPIVIRAQFNPQTCTATSAVLGSAGSASTHRDFPNAPFAATLYNASLANKLSGTDINGATQEINATFNSSLGQTGCLTGSFFYYGYDNNHGNLVNLVSVLLHEFGHGLGFQTFTSNSTGAQSGGFASIFDRFLMDDDSGKSWLQMTNAERQASAINTYKLSWTGPRVFADVPSVLAFGIPVVFINSPSSIAGRYNANLPSYGPEPSAAGLTGNIVQAMDPSDTGGMSTTDACSPLTNAAAVAGNIAIVDRGSCSAKIKTLNAQNAGAIGVIVVNNVAGSPAPGFADDTTVTTPITIPTLTLTQPDGNTIKAQLANGVNGTLVLDMSVRAGTDPQGKMLLNAPNPVVGGSSVSHWDPIARPNQLMEPSINTDLTHNVTPPFDLTLSQLSETGWMPQALPNTITATAGNNQNVQPNAYAPFQVAVSPPVAGLLVTFTAAPGSGTFSTTGSRIATAFTNASGVATSPTFTGRNVGTSTLNATVAGAGTTAFTLTTQFGATSAVSRKTHGEGGTRDIPLPASAPFGVESRSSGGNHTLVYTFNTDGSITGGTASVSSGTGTVSGSPTFSGNTMTVNLTGVTDVQQLAVTLNNVTDSGAQIMPSTVTTMKFLVGDVDGNSTVSTSDIGRTKAESGNAVSASNFRTDVNVSGSIGASDIGQVKASAGNTVP